jgi:hypothetical protein
MKKIIAAIFLIVLLMPIGYLCAENNQTADANKYKISMTSERYLSIPAKQAYYLFKERMAKETQKADFLDCIERQRRFIRYGRMSAGINGTKPHQRYHGTFWVTIQCGK